MSRDAAAIKVREKPTKTPKNKDEKPKKRRRGRPKKGDEKPKVPSKVEQQLKMTQKQRLSSISTHCDKGCKRNSQGNRDDWVGYKLHTDTIDGDIPVSTIAA